MLLVPAARRRRAVRIGVKRTDAMANTQDRCGCFNNKHASQAALFHYKHMHVYTREHQSVLTKLASMAMIVLSL